MLQVFNVSTTVDPSYVISLIRKLIPGDSDESLKAGEEAWEECGCVLWDLAASKTHAELMVCIVGLGNIALLGHRCYG